MDTRPLSEFRIPDEVSHIEISSVHFDQWSLVISMRLYGKVNQEVIGAALIVFRDVGGFRLLDEGSMMQFPWPKKSENSIYLHEVLSSGWADLEMNAGNMVANQKRREFIVVTDNECISILAYSAPILVNE